VRNFAARELAMIASIDGALARETRPDLVALLRALKEGHQDAHAQVAALARLEDRPPARGWPLASMVMELEGWLARSVGVEITLDVLAGLEHKFEVAYGEARDASDGVRRHVLDELMKRAAQRVQLLKHRGRRCMRCLLDRPGPAAPLHREHPHIFICRACHAEVRATFPADVLPQLDAWPAHLREARIIERALGRSARQSARDEVHTDLAGQPPIIHARATKGAARPDQRTGGPVGAPDTTLAVPAVAEAREQAYTDWLFDPRAVRSRW
jgi:hypothetical protein